MHIKVWTAVAIVVVMAVAVSAQDSIETILERAERASQAPASDAVILLDSGYRTIFLDGRREFVGHEQILLLSWEAIDAFGQVSFFYNKNLEEFTLRYGRTILPSGEVVELEEAGISISSYADGGGEQAYSELETIMLSMPSLKPGAVIDYEYVLADKVPLIENEFFDSWFFEWWDPVQLSEYVFDVPNTMDFAWIVNGRSLEPDIQSSSGRTQYTFRVEDVPALMYEFGMPSDLAVDSTVEISSVESWEDIATWWWMLAKDKMIPNAAISEKAVELTSGTTTETERISLLYDFVAREIRYVALQLGSSGYDPRPAQDTFATRYGDCKDQAVLLIALLDSVGIDAYPVLVSSESGYDEVWASPPSPGYFNHVIVALPGTEAKWRFLDPTCSLCSAEFTDGFIRGRRGVLVSDNPQLMGATVDTGASMSEESVVRSTLTGSLLENDLLSLRADVKATGDFDIEYRDLLLYYRASEREGLFAALADYAIPQCFLVDFDYSDLDDTHAPITFWLDIEKERFVRWISGGIGLLELPYGPAFPFPDEYSDTILLDERTHPLITTASQIELHARIDVGSHQVSELPENVWIENEIGSFSATYTSEEGIVIYDRVQRIELAEISLREYPLYQDLILAMLEDAEALVVLRE